MNRLSVVTLCVLLSVAAACGDDDTDTATPSDGGGSDAAIADAAMNDATMDDGFTLCGNGELDESEACDDGNSSADDGCDESCGTESGWSCDGEPSVCRTSCGDGLVAGDEECDDGDTDGFDGCDGSCEVEDLYSCDGEPSTCTADCSDQAIYAAPVGMPPRLEGPTWVMGDAVGLDAADAMCAQVGADHVCTYAEILEAGARGELSEIGTADDYSKLFDELPDSDDGKSFWLHRLTTVDGAAPGPGGRCNDWANSANQSADGEWCRVDRDSGYTLECQLDDDTTYTGDSSDGHQGTLGGATCASKLRAILCCSSACPPRAPRSDDNNGCDSVTPRDRTGEGTLDLSGTFGAPTCVRISVGTTITFTNEVGGGLFGGTYDVATGEKRFHATLDGEGTSPIVPDCNTPASITCTSSFVLDTPGTYPFFVDNDPANQRGAFIVE